MFITFSGGGRGMEWFNWSDMVVVGIILLLGIVGMIRGFIHTSFKIASFIVSLIVAIKFYPVVSELLKKTSVFTKINEWILKSLLTQKEAVTASTASQTQQDTTVKLIDGLNLPDFLKGNLSGGTADMTGLTDLSDTMGTVSMSISNLIISIIGFILLFIAVRLVFMLIRYILEGLAKLPVLKQADKLGGFAFGIVQGLLIVYMACAVLMLFNSSPVFTGIFAAIEDSTVAKFFYENNLIVKLMFPG
jgi:uncharacterized membrane protein required for colicin V production